MLRRILPIVLFALACFPSRGLYFLLHPASPDGQYHGHQPVLNAPTNRTPRLKAAKVPLPARLTQVPRAVKKAPDVAPAAGLAAVSLPSAPSASRTLHLSRGSLLPDAFPASPPPARAPPVSA